MQTHLAPIVLFVYNRPWHTRQTLESLSNNRLSVQSQLYIFSDGPKLNASSVDIEKIEKVRQLIREKKWCKEVEIIEYEKNSGLANSVITGVTKVLDKHEKIIVLEDDLILSTGFLKYMNEALNLYNEEDSVMHVSAYMFPIKKTLSETFFLRNTSCWGWGTWKRAWKHFNPDSKFLLNKILLDKEREIRFNQNNLFSYTSMLKENSEGLNDSWDIRWYASTFLQNGICLHPRRSLVRNIGHDISGVHCKKSWWSSIFTKQKIIKKIDVKKIPLVKSPVAQNAINQFNFKLSNPPFFVRAKEKINIILGINN